MAVLLQVKCDLGLQGPLGVWTLWSCLAEPQIDRICAAGELYPQKEP